MKQLLSYFLLIGMLSVNLATSPEPPEFRYTVSGHLVCDTLSRPVNHTIRLYGFIPGESTYSPFSLLSHNPNPALALTDSSGHFYIESTIYYRLDSLKIALIRPGQAAFFSPAMAVAPFTTTETTFYSQDNSAGCGFGSGSKKRKRTISFVKIADIPFNICP